MKKKPRPKPLRLNDPAAESLAHGLLGGLRPTPPRLRALFQELDRRRKEPTVDKDTLKDLDQTTKRILTEKAVQEIFEPLSRTDVPVRMEDDLEPMVPRTPADVQDAAEGAAIDARKKEYAEHDQRVRDKLLARPASMQKRGRIASLNEATEILLRELDLGHADRVREIARENGWEPWVVILGQVVRAADLNELAAGEFSPEWLNRDGRDAAVASKEICLMCGHAIPGARKGQSACCSRHGSGKVEHNEDCALKHVVMFKGQWVDDRRVEIRPA